MYPSAREGWMASAHGRSDDVSASGDFLRCNMGTGAASASRCGWPRGYTPGCRHTQSGPRLQELLTRADQSNHHDPPQLDLHLLASYRVAEHFTAEAASWRLVPH
jgi:hypothetical protein